MCVDFVTVVARFNNDMAVASSVCDELLQAVDEGLHRGDMCGPVGGVTGMHHFVGQQVFDSVFDVGIGEEVVVCFLRVHL